MFRVREQIGLNKVFVPRKGEGVAVAVLDTGCAQHPDLHNRIKLFCDFVHGESGIYDDNGHGTHVCGILCGSGAESGGRFAGIAPGVDLIVGKVLDAFGEGTMEQMSAALDWILQCKNRYPIRVLNISIGPGESGNFEKREKLQTHLKKISDRGISVFCAAGNNGPSNASASGLGYDKEIIMVGCHDGNFYKNNLSRCAAYSGRGDINKGIRKPDIVAPGTNIISCNNQFLNRPYISRSGTSMATPIIAGIAALVYSNYPNMSPDDFKKRLLYTARDLGEPWNLQGWGMVSAERILNHGI
ncbi:MAG: S8 family serine peptidase [Acetatifactor sp.]|nr:S8 family serine peptidase [Acetatifactor sp.]